MNGIFTLRSGTSFVGALIRRKRKGSPSSQGLAAPSTDIARHSEAERFAHTCMSAMTLVETGHSSRTLSLNDIIAGHKFNAGKVTLRFREILERLTCGGRPGFLDEIVPILPEGFRDYLSSLAEVGLAMGIGTGRELVRMCRFLVALARGVSTGIFILTLALDEGLTNETVSSYLATLIQVFAIEDPSAQSNHLRSKAALRTEGEYSLADPSLVVAALWADPQSLLCDPRYVGQLFESQAVYNPRVYSGQLVRYARIPAGARVDAVIGYPGGPLLLIEIKLDFHEGVTEAALASPARPVAKTNSALHPDVVRFVTTGGAWAFTYLGRGQCRATDCFD